MALEHAILVSLLEQPGSGYELAHRFDRSIGRFWTATHQQIYRVLKRMGADGWITAEQVAQRGRPDKRAGRSPTPAGPCSPTGSVSRSNRRRFATTSPSRSAAPPSTTRPARSPCSSRSRGTAPTTRRCSPVTWPASAATSPGPSPPTTRPRLQHVVLRGGIAYERMVLAWLDDVLPPCAASTTDHPRARTA